MPIYIKYSIRRFIMLDFFKRLFGLAPKPVAVTEPAPYKVETPAPVEELAPVVAEPVETPSPAQVAKKAATGAAKTTRRRKKPAAT